MISAREARKMVVQGTNDRTTKQMEQIKQKITDAINRSRLSISMNGTIARDNKIKLEELGYRVSADSQYNQPYFSITW